MYDDIARLLGMEKQSAPSARFAKVESVDGKTVRLVGGGEAVRFCGCSAGDIVVVAPVGGGYAAISTADAAASSTNEKFSGNYNDLTNKPTKLSEFINDVGYINTEIDPTVYPISYDDIMNL